MLKRVLCGTAVALAAALLCAGAALADAPVVTFEDQVFDAANFPNTFNAAANAFDEQGLHFEGLEFFFWPGANPAGAPFAHSTFMETAGEPVTISRTGGGTFDLNSLELALTFFNLSPVDSVTLTGVGACAPACTTTLTVNDQGFTRYDLTGFTGLSALHVSLPTFVDAGGVETETGYLAFDNLNGPIPEPAEWLLMIGGLAASALMLRRARQLAAVDA